MFVILGMFLGWVGVQACLYYAERARERRHLERIRRLMGINSEMVVIRKQIRDHREQLRQHRGEYTKPEYWEGMLAEMEGEPDGKDT